MGIQKNFAACGSPEQTGSVPEGTRKSITSKLEGSRGSFMNPAELSIFILRLRASVINSLWVRIIRVRILTRPRLYLSIFFVVLLLLSMASRAHPEDKYGFQIRKDPELQQIRPKKPVRIKLKRTGKSEYLWELTGDDADEIIKTDKKLRKLLNE